ncbi:hypothetical protein ACJRPK_15250 [Aquimarina sp. 2-A2]|uniref:hypothetical protein n=1 Tax=Aquimarina sp. 2-A2 TaxID=3382644 RepID=UPI00387F014A
MEQNLNIAEKSFSNEWWEKFVTATNGFSGCTVRKNMFNKSQLETFHKYVVNTIRTITSNEDRIDDARVGLWFNHDPNIDTKTFFKNHPIPENSNIQEWIYAIFQREVTYGLTMNFAESHNDELSDEIHRYIAPYLEKHGIPVEGINTTLIVGNYGWTPIGIHNDKRGEYIIHFHLGPGDKDMYIWDEQKAIKKGFVPRQPVENVSDYMNDYDRKYTFGKGDLFSMPGRCVHIGNTKEFSVGIIIQFNMSSLKNLSKRLWLDLNHKIISHKNEKKILPLPPYKETRHHEYNKMIMEHLKYYNVNAKNKVSDILKDSYRDHKLGLLSNGGYIRAPFVNKEKLLMAYKNQDKKSDFRLRSTARKILYYIKNDTIYIFSNNNKFSIKNHPSYTKLIELLNNKEIINYAEVIADERKLIPFIKMLYMNLGVSFLSEPE